MTRAMMSDVVKSAMDEEAPFPTGPLATKRRQANQFLYLTSGGGLITARHAPPIAAPEERRQPPVRERPIDNHHLVVPTCRRRNWILRSYWSDQSRVRTRSWSMPLAGAARSAACTPCQRRRPVLDSGTNPVPLVFHSRHITAAYTPGAA